MTRAQIQEFLRSAEQMCHAARLKLALRDTDWAAMSEDIDDAMNDLGRAAKYVEQRWRARVAAEDKKGSE